MGLTASKNSADAGNKIRATAYIDKTTPLDTIVSTGTGRASARVPSLAVSSTNSLEFAPKPAIRKKTSANEIEVHKWLRGFLLSEEDRDFNLCLMWLGKSISMTAPTLFADTFHYYRELSAKPELFGAALALFHRTRTLVCLSEPVLKTILDFEKAYRGPTYDAFMNELCDKKNAPFTVESMSLRIAELTAVSVDLSIQERGGVSTLAASRGIGFGERHYTCILSGITFFNDPRTRSAHFVSEKPPLYRKSGDAESSILPLLGSRRHSV